MCCWNWEVLLQLLWPYPDKVIWRTKLYPDKVIQRTRPYPDKVIQRTKLYPNKVIQRTRVARDDSCFSPTQTK